MVSTITFHTPSQHYEFFFAGKFGQNEIEPQKPNFEFLVSTFNAATTAKWKVCLTLAIRQK